MSFTSEALKRKIFSVSLSEWFFSFTIVPEFDFGTVCLNYYFLKPVRKSKSVNLTRTDSDEMLEFEKSTLETLNSGQVTLSIQLIKSDIL